MSMIIGMDPWVFMAWILTILSAIFCVLYGIYHEFLKKPKQKTQSSVEKKKTKEMEEK